MEGRSTQSIIASTALSVATYRKLKFLLDLPKDIQKWEKHFSKIVRLQKNLDAVIAKFKKEIVKINTEGVRASFTLTIENLEDQRQLLRKTADGLATSVRLYKDFQKKLKANRKIGALLKLATTRKRRDESLVNQLLVDLKKQLGGPVQIERFFNSFPETKPSTLPKSINSEHFRKRIERTNRRL